jgi:hypothetical protein
MDWFATQAPLQYNEHKRKPPEEDGLNEKEGRSAKRSKACVGDATQATPSPDITTPAEGTTSTPSQMDLDELQEINRTSSTAPLGGPSPPLSDVAREWQRLSAADKEGTQIWVMVGLDFNAAISLIEETRRKLLLRWHPDKNPHDEYHANEVAKLINDRFEKWIQQRHKFGSAHASPPPQPPSPNDVAREWKRLTEAEKRGWRIWMMVGLTFSSRICDIQALRWKLLEQWKPENNPHDLYHARKVIDFLNTHFATWLEERRSSRRRRRQDSC